MAERDIGKPEDKGHDTQNAGNSQLAQHALERHVNTPAQTMQHTADMVSSGHLPSFTVLGGDQSDFAAGRAGNSRLQQQQQGERAEDSLRLAVMPRDYGQGHVELPTAEQVRTAPVEQLQKMLHDNQNSLVGAIQHAWDKLPSLGFHGTGKEGVEGLNRDHENKDPFYIGTPWKKAGDAVGYLGDMMRSIGFASSYAKENGGVFIVDPGLREGPNGKYRGVTEHNPDANPNPLAPPGEHTGETTVTITKDNFAQRIKGMLSPDTYNDLRKIYDHAAGTADHYMRALLGDAFFRQGMAHDALVAVGAIKEGQGGTRGGEGQQQEQRPGQMPGRDGDQIITIDDGWQIGRGGSGGGNRPPTNEGDGGGGAGHMQPQPEYPGPPQRQMQPQPEYPGPPQRQMQPQPDGPDHRPRLQPQPDQPGDDPLLKPQPDGPGGKGNGGPGESPEKEPDTEEIFNPTRPPGIDGMSNGESGSDRPDHVDWRNAKQTALVDGSTKYDYNGQLIDRSKDGTGHDTKVDFSSSVVVGPDGKTILGSTTNYDPPVDQNYAGKDMRADTKVIPEHGPKVEIEGVKSVSTMNNADGSQTSMIVGKNGTYIFQTDQDNVVRDVIGPDGKHIK